MRELQVDQHALRIMPEGGRYKHYKIWMVATFSRRE